MCREVVRVSEIRPKLPKQQQKVWLDFDVYVKVLDLSQKLGIAPNVVCSQIVATYLRGPNEPIRELTVEKVVERKVFACPACLAEFGSVREFLRHLESLEGHLEGWLKGQQELKQQPKKIEVK
jgi:uncharacterized C2H2 Zn-finger protein